jgi:enoyl-CoA hydratase/carnithine racemase
MTHLAYDIADGLATVTLRNPPQNRISAQMSDELAEAVDAIGKSKARALLLRADGPDFSFGGDIVPWPTMTTRELRAHFEHAMSVFNQFERLPIPTIAAVQGHCFGGGLELAIRADMIFAGESARFGHPEQSLGIVTLLGGVYRVAERAGRARAAEMAFTSEPIPARTMQQYGVVNRVFSDDALAAESLAFAQKIARGPTLAHAAHKALIRAWALGGVRAADEALFDIAMPLFETDDVKKGIPSAVNALAAGKPRPALPWSGR